MNTPSVKLSKLAEHFKVTKKEAHGAILRHGNAKGIKLLCDVGRATHIQEELFLDLLATDERLREMRFQEDLVVENAFPHIPFDTVPRIYFLLDGGGIVYVGKSHGLPTRIMSHMENKVFSLVSTFQVLAEDLDIIEAVNIRHYTPWYNIDVMPNRIYLKHVLLHSTMPDRW